jgi:hypothetical protein
VPAQVLEDIQILIDGFVKKNCLISRERMHRTPEFGGAGMFDLRNFLQAQKCCWLTRAINCPIDNWQFDLVATVLQNRLELLRPVDIDPDKNPPCCFVPTLLRRIHENQRELPGFVYF